MEYKAQIAKTFTIDFTARLPTGVTISSATNTLGAGLTEDATSHDSDKLVNVTISGGDLGQAYENRCDVTGSDGKPYRETWYLKVQKSIN